MKTGVNSGKKRGKYVEAILSTGFFFVVKGPENGGIIAFHKFEIFPITLISFCEKA